MEMYRLLHIDGLRTSPYHSQTDGMVECYKGDAVEKCFKRWKRLGSSSTVRTLCLPGGPTRIDRILAFRGTIYTDERFEDL